MKELKCISDIGSVLVGNKDWSFAIPNIGGDGITIIVIFENCNEFRKYEENNSLKFISSIQGTFNIYIHDCAFECRNDDVIETLSGRYGVYQGEMKVAFVKWN